MTKACIHKMEKQNFLYAVLQTVVFLIPVATLVWKAARQSAQIEMNCAAIKELERKLSQTDNTVDVQLAQIQTRLNEIKVSLAKLETRLDYESRKEG